MDFLVFRIVAGPFILVWISGSLESRLGVGSCPLGLISGFLASSVRCAAWHSSLGHLYKGFIE